MLTPFAGFDYSLAKAGRQGLLLVNWRSPCRLRSAADSLHLLRIRGARTGPGEGPFWRQSNFEEEHANTLPTLPAYRNIGPVPSGATFGLRRRGTDWFHASRRVAADGGCRDRQRRWRGRGRSSADGGRGDRQRRWRGCGGAVADGGASGHWRGQRHGWSWGCWRCRRTGNEDGVRLRQRRRWAHVRGEGGRLRRLLGERS